MTLLPALLLEMGLLIALLAQELAVAVRSWLARCIRTILSEKWAVRSKKEEDKGPPMANALLELPDLALELVLEKLPPAALATAGCVCSGLRKICGDDHFWDAHLQRKWSRAAGVAAEREWMAASFADGSGRHAAAVARPTKRWRLLEWMSHRDHAGTLSAPEEHQRAVSAMSWFAALESGRCWFQAQVYNRESGHVGFLMSCYDAHLSYDRRTDTFCARYPPHGQKPVKMENRVPWSRIRTPPLETPANALHVSDCLDELGPGDHFEIQWRKSKEFPYGWWYGTVGHRESCIPNDRLCRCGEDDTVVLEFQHYAPGSRWRRAAIRRKDHRETGNEADGFYGGVRKLRSAEEIAAWRQFWPAEALE